jgi:hypothetical protein
MALVFQHPLIRFLRKSLLALLFCLSFSVIPNQAHAAISPCRGDPIITLSNGMVITINIGLDVAPTYLTRVDYIVHVPVGVTVMKINKVNSTISNIPIDKEYVTVIADLGAKQYKTSTIATTTAPANVTVTAKFTNNSLATTSGVLTTTAKNSVALPINYTAP